MKELEIWGLRVSCHQNPRVLRLTMYVVGAKTCRTRAEVELIERTAQVCRTLAVGIELLKAFTNLFCRTLTVTTHCDNPLKDPNSNSYGPFVHIPKCHCFRV